MAVRVLTASIASYWVENGTCPVADVDAIAPNTSMRIREFRSLLIAFTGRQSADNYYYYFIFNANTLYLAL